MENLQQAGKHNYTYQILDTTKHIGGQEDEDVSGGLAEFIRIYSLIPMHPIKATISVIFLIGILANSLLVLYLLASRRYKTPMFTIVTSLSIADLGTCFAAILLLTFLYPTMEIPGTEFICSVTYFIMLSFYFVSIHHLVLFACMRYAQLIHPLWSRARITWHSVFAVCSGIWICNCTVNIFFIVSYNAHNFQVMNQTITLCAYDSRTYNEEAQYYYTASIGFVIPAVVITSAHIIKQCILNRNVKKSLTVQNDRRLNSDPRALTIVLLLYYLTVTPNLLYVSIFSIFRAQPGDYHHLLFIGFVMLSSSNSVMDPFVYCIAARSVRMDMQSFFCRCRHRQQQHSVKIFSK